MDDVDVDEFTQRAAKLRSDGRLEESLLAARRATGLGPESANAWWQLALTLRRLSDNEKALPALEKVTELAPDFASGWCELGAVHEEGGRNAEAIANYELALAADSEHVLSTRLLAHALKNSKSEAAAQRRLELLRTLRRNNALGRDDLFDLAFLLAELNETAEATRMYETYTSQYLGWAAYFNLALLYQRSGRDADMLDALDMASHHGYEGDQLGDLREHVQHRLLALSNRAGHRSVSLLTQNEWYEHYVNPFALLDADNVDDLCEHPKALQKARQAVLREIELEDGRLAWMPGLVLDRSAALARLDKLNEKDAWEAHRSVFENKALCDFLSRGDLTHFLRRTDGTVQPMMPHLLDQSLLKLIGPAFAAQYNKVLGRAIERGDVDTVECLFKGRRWVAPEDEERCFDGAKRALERLRAPILALNREAEQRTVSLHEIERALDAGSLSSLLRHLPIEFYETHSEVGYALRSLAIEHFGRENDAIRALEILRLTKICADKLPALAHHVAVDEKTLNDIIAEERSKEAHFTFAQKSLSITRAGIAHGDHQLAPSSVSSLRWGMVKTSAAPETVRYTVGFQSRSGRDIIVTWTTSLNLDSQLTQWSKLVDATFNFVVGAVLAWFSDQVDRGHPVRVGDVEVVPTGVVMDEKGWIFTTRVTVPWSQLKSSLVNGSLVLSSRVNSKAGAEMPLETTWNAVVLHLYATKKENASS